MTSSLLAMAVMGVLSSPVQEKTVDLAISGATLKAVGEELGKQAGWTVELDPRVENEVLVLRAKGASLQEVIAKVADVTGTTWIQNGEQMLIQPDFNVRAAELARAKAENAKKLIDAKGKYLDSLKPQKYKDGEDEFEYEPEPESLLVGEMVRGLSDQFLTSLLPGQRIVLSSNPTRMQRPLGRFNGQAITEWIARENESRKAQQEMIDDQGDEEGMAMLQMFGGMFDQYQPKPITEAPQKVLLVLERSGRTEFDEVLVNINLQVMGASGNILLATQANLSGYGGRDGTMARVMEAAAARGIEIPIAGEKAPDEEHKPMPGDDIKITVSEDVQAVFDATGMDFENPMAMKVSGRARELMMRVDLHEPMRYEIGEFLLEAAEKRDKTFIALLPDRVRQFGPELPKTLKDVRESLPEYDLVETEGGTWWTILPKDRGEVWTRRMDRRALTGTLMTAQSKFYVPLDVLSTFIYRFPDAEKNTMVSQRLRLFAPQLQSGFGGDVDQTMLRLFGGMTQQERQVMRNGGSIPLARLSAGAKSVLEEKFFGFSPTLTAVDVEKDLVPQGPAESMSEMMGMGMMMAGGGVGNNEPTEVMPVGLPPQGVVSMRVNRENYLVAVSKEGTIMPGIPPFGRNELAMLSLLMKNAEFMAEMQEVGQIMQNLRSGVRDQLHMVVLVAPSMGAKGVLSDPKDPDMSRPYTINNLPEAVRQQMDADREALEKSPMGKFFEMMGSGMGGFGGGGPIKP